jgi:hypothetical protein
MNPLDTLRTTLVVCAVTTLGVVLMALGGFWPQLVSPNRPTTDWLKAISGGYFVRLSHEGDQSPFDLWRPDLPEHEVRGVVTRVQMDGAGEPLGSLAIYDYLSLRREEAKPTQLDLKSDDGLRWRLEVAAFSADEQLSLDLSMLTGRRVRLRAQSITFGVTTFHWLRLDDEQGLVLTLDHRLLDAESDVALAVGQRLATLSNGCSDLAVHALELAGQSRTAIEPGQEGALRLRDRDYRAWNLDTSLIAGNQRCTCLVDQVAWMLLRAH